MHEQRGNFCIFLLKIAEKEGKSDLHVKLASRAAPCKAGVTAAGDELDDTRRLGEVLAEQDEGDREAIC